jgi:hypothetical protein
LDPKNDLMIHEDLMSVPEIAQAIGLTKESSYTRAELEAYDKYWDTISTEKTFIADAEARGEARGETRKINSLVLNSYDNGIEISFIAKITELSVEKVESILKENNRIA